MHREDTACNSMAVPVVTVTAAAVAMTTAVGPSEPSAGHPTMLHTRPAQSANGTGVKIVLTRPQGKSSRCTLTVYGRR